MDKLNNFNKKKEKEKQSEITKDIYFNTKKNYNQINEDNKDTNLINNLTLQNTNLSNSNYLNNLTNQDLLNLNETSLIIEKKSNNNNNINGIVYHNKEIKENNIKKFGLKKCFHKLIQKLKYEKVYFRCYSCKNFLFTNFALKNILIRSSKIHKNNNNNFKINFIFDLVLVAKENLLDFKIEINELNNQLYLNKILNLINLEITGKNYFNNKNENENNDNECEFDFILKDIKCKNCNKNIFKFIIGNSKFEELNNKLLIDNEKILIYIKNEETGKLCEFDLMSYFDNDHYENYKLFDFNNNNILFENTMILEKLKNLPRFLDMIGNIKIFMNNTEEELDMLNECILFYNYQKMKFYNS
jgi:hypothetical protein